MSARPARIMCVQRPSLGHAHLAGQQPDLGTLANVVRTAHSDSNHRPAFLARTAIPATLTKGTDSLRSVWRFLTICYG